MWSHSLWCGLYWDHTNWSRDVSRDTQMGGGHPCGHTEFCVGTPLVTLNGRSSPLWPHILGCGDFFGPPDWGGLSSLGHLDWSVDPPVITGWSSWWEEFHTPVVVLMGAHLHEATQTGACTTLCWTLCSLDNTGVKYTQDWT